VGFDYYSISCRALQHQTLFSRVRSRKGHLSTSRMISIPSNTTKSSKPIKSVRTAPFRVVYNYTNCILCSSFTAAIWPYSGKRYIQLFPPPPHNPPQQSPHMAPPGPPPMPPPPYEEDQAAARGYVYAPYPYPYPGQVGLSPDSFHMMINLTHTRSL